MGNRLVPNGAIPLALSFYCTLLPMGLSSYDSALASQHVQPIGELLQEATFLVHGDPHRGACPVHPTLHKVLEKVGRLLATDLLHDVVPSGHV